MREALALVRAKLLGVLALLADFAAQYKDMPALAYTHLQPAQLTTVGKRATLWMNELYMDYLEVDHRLRELALLGSKGTTGTQASFVELFGGDDGKIRRWSSLYRPGGGYGKGGAVSGQTYSPQGGLPCGTALSGVAQSASKLGERPAHPAKL